MSYLPQLRSELVRAAERRREVFEGLPPSRGMRSRMVPWRWARGSWLRWSAINLAIGVLGTVAGLGAAGVFNRGTALGPSVAPSPIAGEGVALPGSARLLALRTSDPSGGLPWGLRVVRTTRGLECVDVGRVDYGTIGVLGQDGAFDDDRRFHPVSTNVFGNLGCATIDARGHAFVNVALQNQPASGLAGLGEASDSGGCVSAEELPRHLPQSIMRLIQEHRHRPVCPQADMREIYFGLLGPDARSVTYRLSGGGQRTIATVGAQGAYLLVLPQATSGCMAPARAGRLQAGCRYGGRGDRGGPNVPSGVISSIAYRGGRVCHVAAPGTFASMFGSCPPVGFLAAPRRIPTHAQLATAISVHALPAKHYCAKVQGEEAHGDGFIACERGAPPGYRRITGGWPSLLEQIDFTARVAITGSGSWYEVEISLAHAPGCAQGGTGGPTDFDIHAGERIQQRMFAPYRCHGLAHGTVTYVPIVGAAGAMPVTGLPGQGKPVLVGRFNFLVPSAPRNSRSLR
jgi:hypothetical protein